MGKVRGRSVQQLPDMSEVRERHDSQSRNDAVIGSWTGHRKECPLVWLDHFLDPVQSTRILLMMIKAFSRFLVVVPIPNEFTVTVAKAVHWHLFVKFDLCSVIQSERGWEFWNEILSSICKTYGIRLGQTTAGRPVCNGRKRKSCLIYETERTLNVTARNRATEDIYGLKWGSERCHGIWKYEYVEVTGCEENSNGRLMTASVWKEVHVKYWHK
jgi:hypothetical protein